MKEKEYPMPETYNKALASLASLIEARDNLAASLKLAAPAEAKKLRELLVKANKKIEDGEARLAADYEEHQKRCRKEEESDRKYEETMRKMEMLWVYFKHRLPDQLDLISAPIFKTFTKYEQVEAFFDRIAILEATKLDEILDEKNLDKFDF